ncbi:LacI family DNA-binding transcriptional regulator [Sphingobacterium sp. NPDC055346]
MKVSELSGVKEIARRANVSIATVDRVLHNRTGVAQKTKEKILSIIKEMDYKPNILAKRLASKRVYKFGILIPKECSEADQWNAPVSGIKEALSEFGDFGVDLRYYFFDTEDRLSFIEQSEELLNKHIDGVIVVPIFINETREFAAKCIERRIQFVFIESQVPKVHPLSYIWQDLEQSGRVVGHLCQYLIQPKDEILVVNVVREKDSIQHLEEKIRGFEQYFLDSHYNCSIDSFNIEINENDEFSVFMDDYLLNKNPKLIYVTNSRAYIVASYLKNRGLDHIKLVGNGYHSKNIEFLKDGIIDFLICQKPLEQGYKAFLALYEFFIAKRKVVKLQYMPIDIVTRENYQYYEN